MAKVTMSTAFPGSTVDSDGVLIPWTALKDVSLSELSSADDLNVFMRGLVEGLYERIQALPSGSRPTRMSMSQGSQSTVPNLRNALNQPYTINFIITATSFEVVSE